MTLQRPDEALSQIQLAIDLDPLNPLIQGLYGGVLLDAGDYQLAIIQAEKVLSAVPNHPLGLVVLYMAHYFNKDYEESIEAWITYFRLNEETKLSIQKTFNKQGFHAAIEEFIIELKKATGDSYPMDIASLYTVVNNYTKALEWYEKAYKNHDPNMPYLSTAFISFNNIKDDPGFIELLKKMNLPLNKKDRK
jgi:tetratricopeptide (TPR) repeat protein